MFDILSPPTVLSGNKIQTVVCLFHSKKEVMVYTVRKETCGLSEVFKAKYNQRSHSIRFHNMRVLGLYIAWKVQVWSYQVALYMAEL